MFILNSKSNYANLDYISTDNFVDVKHNISQNYLNKVEKWKSRY